jgi:hypothetical protein
MELLGGGVQLPASGRNRSLPFIVKDRFLKEASGT